MKNKLISDLDVLSRKIELNTASLIDYKRYEAILREGGLSHEYIFQSLNKAGFTTWEEFIAARNKKQNSTDIEAGIVGGLLGLGLGLLLVGIFSGDKK
jgi:hypothetical protein